MSITLREIPLPNGLVVRFIDHTRLYYGDFYLVKLEITCEVPVSSDCFAVAADYEEALRLLGPTVTYRKEVEQMGVPSTEIDRVRERLIDDFSGNSLQYFTRGDFPAKLVRSELQKVLKKRARFGS